MNHARIAILLFDVAIPIGALAGIILIVGAIGAGQQ